MVSTADESVDRPSTLFIPLALSLLMHGVLVLMMVASALRTPSNPSQPFEVELQTDPSATAQAKVPPKAEAEAPPAPKEEAVTPPKNQIVSPPDSPEEKPDKARLLSERDSKTLQETVKRGEPAPPAKPPQEKPQAEVSKKLAEQKPAAKARGEAEGLAKGSSDTKTEPQKSSPSTQTAPMIGLSDLFFKPSEIARDPVLRKGESGDDSTTEQGSKRDLASLSRPQLWADPGQRGTPDYLPDVRQGDFTLLNTKADRFAPFVRRVGLRVFQSFSMEFKQQIYQGNVPQGRDNVEVEAVMSPDGKRTDVYLKQRNGNLSSDRVLLGTLNDHIFFDQNPPAQAIAEDGRIHFVFALNAQVWYAHDENGRVQPGAHWVFGAGLL